MFLLSKRIQHPSNIYHFTLGVIFIIAFHSPCFSQAGNSSIIGNVIDASSHIPLAGVVISYEGDSSEVVSSAEGFFSIKRSSKSNTLFFKLSGFASRRIDQLPQKPSRILHLNILLYPVQLMDTTRRSLSVDSIAANGDSELINSYGKELFLPAYNRIKFQNTWDQDLQIHSRGDKVGILLSTINGLNLQDDPHGFGLTTARILGMDQRYTQLLVNGAALPEFNQTVKSLPTLLFPAEMISAMKLMVGANVAKSSDVGSGTIMLETKDQADQNFYYLKLGGGYAQATINKPFYKELSGSTSQLGFPKLTDLPSGFPTTRSQSALAQKNPQEQVDLSKQLKNNLSPLTHKSRPNEQILFQAGHNFKLKNGTVLSLIGFVNQDQTESIESITVQTRPLTSINPYPFRANEKVIASESQDLSYRYSSQFQAGINGSIRWRNNKVSLRTSFSNQYSADFTRRSGIVKPDEDTLAHDAIVYLAEQRRFMASQLSGVHALGKNGRFQVDWLASYAYYHQEDPDQRSFLLRRDSSDANQFEIASQITPSLSTSLEGKFTNSGRLWRDMKEHNFTGAFNLGIPYNLFNVAQQLKGGIYIQTRYRVFYSDLFLYSGQGFETLDQLLAPDRYFPGGVTVSNYYTKVNNPGGNVDPSTLLPSNRGNYIGSSNTGAAYLQSYNQLGSKLSIDLGLRVEANSQLVANTEYIFFSGYKNSQINTLDENNRITQTNLLPSARIIYKPMETLQISGGFFKTINRPQLQELTSYRYYDPLRFTVRAGNQLLRPSQIENYEAGIDWLPASTINISFGGFYKRMDRPIEYIASGYFTGNAFLMPHNMAPATVQGLTAAFKTALGRPTQWLSHVIVFGSGTVSKSSVKEGPTKSPVSPIVREHELSGTSPNTIKFGVRIEDTKWPGLTISYDRTADYLSMLGSGELINVNGKMISTIPDYRINGRDQLDIMISQTFFKRKLEVVAGVRNLLKESFVEYQDLNGNEKFDAALKHDGFVFSGGVDNTVWKMKGQQNFYFTISYSFK